MAEKDILKAQAIIKVEAAKKAVEQAKDDLASKVVLFKEAVKELERVAPGTAFDYSVGWK